MADDQTQDDYNERKAVRRELRQRMNEVQQDREILLTGDTSKLFDRLKESEAIFPRVKAPREACLDAKLIRTLLNVGKEKIQALNTSLMSFEPLEFAEKLATKFKEGNSEIISSTPTAEDWMNFGNVASHFFFRVPSFHFMSGTFEKGEVVRKQRKQSERIKDGNEKTERPEKITTVNKDQETTTMEVERVLSLLWTYYKQYDTPIDYFEFVTNPDSFSHTIENIFHVSFLIKDGLAEISLDEDNLPVIAPIQPPSERSASSSNQIEKRNQMIVSLTKAEWKEIVKVYRIDSPLITPRPETQQ